MKIFKSYKLKIYPNRQKAKELNKLLAFWQDQVNRKIRIFWTFNIAKGSFCPKEYCKGGRLIVDSSKKAWQIVKGARALKQKARSHFTGTEIDLNQASAYIIEDLQTKEFDIWFSVIRLNSRKRLKLPCKRTEIFNKAIKQGKLRKSFKLIKEGKNFYMQCFVELPDKTKTNKKMLGIDVGLNNAIVTSNGKFYGKEIKALRIKTKHRVYKQKLSPQKQLLNHYGNKLAKKYPKTDFIVEDLSFKGKKKRTKKFRRRNNTWAYNQLANKLERLGKAKGFSLLKVDPHFTSQQCPKCGFTDKTNRKGELFQCKQCGFKGNADTVGAVNILSLGRLVREFSSPKLVAIGGD